MTRICILLLITQVLHRQYYPARRKTNRKTWIAVVAVVIATSIMLLLMFRIYYGPDFTVGEIVNAISYKLFGEEPETIGGLIKYCAEYGFLEGRTLPNLHGFLSHEIFDMNSALHIYMFGPGGMTAYPAVTEGYLNFGWLGLAVFCLGTYTIIVGLDKMFRKLPQTELTFSLLMVCCLIATEVSQLSLSATFVSLTLTVVIGFFMLLDYLGLRFSRFLASANAWQSVEPRA